MPLHAAVDPRQEILRAAAFALLGMLNWAYQWYKPGGSLRMDDLARQYTTILFERAL